MSSYASREARVSFYSILVFLLLFYSGYFLILSISHPVAISFLFHLRSCVDIICIIAVILIYHSDYIACSGYLSLSVYTLFSIDLQRGKTYNKKS